MRYGFLALALTAFVAFAAAPALAGCGIDHAKTAQTEQGSSIAQTPLPGSDKNTGG